MDVIDQDGWITARIRCNVCKYEWVACFPSDADDDELECPECHAESSSVVRN